MDDVREQGEQKMKDTDWEIIYELYRIPNITKVANKLYMTQPSLTKRLQGIENEFHIKVVDRTPKGVKFTPEGVLLAKRADKYMQFMKETKKEMQLYREDMTGTILLGSAYSYQKDFLNSILAAYAPQHPHTNFEVVNEPSSALFRKVCDKDLDAAFVQGNYTGAVQQYQVRVYRAYILYKEAVDLKELEHMPMIGYRSNDKTRELLEKWWLQQFQQLPATVMSVTHIDFAWQLVTQGLGFTMCFLPDTFNYPGITLTPMLLPDGKPIERYTWFVWRDTEGNSDILEDFIEYVKGHESLK